MESNSNGKYNMITLDKAIKMTYNAPQMMSERIDRLIRDAAERGHYQVKVNKDWDERITGEVLDLIEEQGFSTNDKREYILIRWM